MSGGSKEGGPHAHLGRAAGPALVDRDGRHVAIHPRAVMAPVCGCAAIAVVVVALHVLAAQVVVIACARMAEPVHDVGMREIFMHSPSQARGQQSHHAGEAPASTAAQTWAEPLSCKDLLEARGNYWLQTQSLTSCRLPRADLAQVPAEEACTMQGVQTCI